MEGVAIPDDAELPRRHLRAVLLLLLDREQSHGYELLIKVQSWGFPTVDTAALYRVLHAMDREELLDSWWEPSQSGPPRRTYRLSVAGREALRGEVGRLEAAHALLGQIIAAYRARASRP